LWSNQGTTPEELSKTINIPRITSALAEIQIKHILKSEMLQLDPVCLILSFTSPSVHTVGKDFHAKELVIKK
jgi:hypothetical protein